MAGKNVQRQNGGRPKGVLNRNSLALRERLENAKIDLPMEVRNSLRDLDDLMAEANNQAKPPPWLKLAIIKAKSEICLDLMKFVFPTLKAQEQDPDQDKDTSMELKITYTAKWGTTSEPTDGD